MVIRLLSDEPIFLTVRLWEIKFQFTNKGLRKEILEHNLFVILGLPAFTFNGLSNRKSEYRFFESLHGREEGTGTEM
jgi:hypothetical protein